MNQELQYLREEMNNMLTFYNEHASKTVNTVLLVWGGALVLLGRGGNMSFENILLYSFIIATVFFISNIILYQAAIKYYECIDWIYKLGAYIAVFYEKRPSETVKVDDKNFCWELATLEKRIIHDATKPQLKNDAEYIRLSTFSIWVIFACIFLIFFSAHKLDIWFNWSMRNICIILSIIICFFYLIISICWRLKIPKYTAPKDMNTMRCRHLIYFINYSLTTKCAKIEKLREKFGKDLWDHLDKQNGEGEFEKLAKSLSE